MMARKTTSALKSRAVLVLLVWTALVVILIVAVLYQNQHRSGDMATSTPSPSQRDLWTAKSISNYQMRIVTEALPVVPVGLDLTIQNGTIVKQSIIACDNPSEENPSQYCDIIRQYYSYLAQYTVEQLFDTADQCIAQTRTSLAICPAFKNDFRGFSTFDELWNAAKTCKDYLPVYGSLCAVQYDSDYGYPKMISSFTPGANDGSVTITIKDFRVTP